jgi:hypothetical protein
MPPDAELIFAEHAARLYAKHHGFPPIAGRLLGYLAICDPAEQTIGELAEALLASRSAITGAAKLLEPMRLLSRTRRAGERMDRISVSLAALEPQNFDSGLFRDQAALFREGLALLPENASARRAPLEEGVALAEFLDERLPQVAAEWRERRAALQASGQLTDPQKNRR